jgi:hypothetical protein
MIARGANSRFYLSGAGKTPIWEIFSRESVRDLTVQVGNSLLLSRVIARFSRAHKAILSNNVPKHSSDPEFQLSHCYFVPIFLARIIMHKLQMFSVLHEMNGIMVCGICRENKLLVVDHEHHASRHELSHIRDFLCHTCNWCIMSVIDRLGNDKGYVTNAGALSGNADQAASALLRYIKNELRDERLTALQDDFDRCAAELFGFEFLRLIGATHEMRLCPDLKAMIQELVSPLTSILIHR